MTIIIVLQDKLDEIGMKQRELARLTGLRPMAINKLCNNKTQRIDKDALDIICEVLDCEITDILKRVKKVQDDNDQ